MSGNKFQIKRTGIAGRQPNTTNSSNSAYIDVGELALNFSDFILYSSDGNTAFEVGANVTNQNITGTLTANGSVGSNGQVLTSNGSGIYWGVGGGGASISEWTEITSDYTAENGDRLLADTTANSFVVTLPATPDVGDSIQIADGGNWSVNNLAIDRNGETIEGDANNLILDVGDILVYFIYGGNGPTWQVKATLGEKGETGNTGPPGIEISNTEPTNTEILWADTSENGLNIFPTGGDTGQYLVKASTGDFDVEWVSLETDLSSITGNVVPSAANTYDLGSATNTWKDLYLSGNSIFLGNVTITETTWDEVSTGVLPYDGTISGLTANTVKEAIDETVSLTDTAYSNAVAYADAVGNSAYSNAVLYTDSAVANLIDTAPDALNTLNELAAALNDDPDFANTVVGQVTTSYTNATSYTDSSISALGLGSMATQNNNSVNIDGGTIDGTAVNATTLTTSGDVNFDSATLFVDSSTNNVGIGTTSPAVKFEVSGAGSVAQLKRPGVATILFGLDGAKNEIFSRDGGTGDFPLAIFTGSSERMRIDSSGNVGIGTTAPQDLLHLSANGPVLSLGSTGSSDPRVDFYDQATTTIGASIFLDQTDDTLCILRTASGSALDGLRIDSSGNVGIGTTSPSQKFHISGGKSIISSSNNGFGQFQIGNPGSNGEASIGFISGVTQFGGSPTSTNGNSHIWAIGPSVYGIGGDTFGIANKTRGSILNVTSSGAVSIVGSLSKGSGSFKIDHPLKQETHHLVHSFIEGPQADLIYRGKVSLVNGQATVNIDEAGRMTEGTFKALNCNVQCFTNNESGWTCVRGSVSGNILTIEAQDETCTDEISWMVIGERCDQHMIDTDWTDENGRVITEPEKEQQDAD